MVEKEKRKVADRIALSRRTRSADHVEEGVVKNEVMHTVVSQGRWRLDLIGMVLATRITHQPVPLN